MAEIDRAISDLEREEHRTRIFGVREATLRGNVGEIVEVFERWKSIRSMLAFLRGDVKELRVFYPSIDGGSYDEERVLVAIDDAMGKYLSPEVLRERLVKPISPADEERK